MPIDYEACPYCGIRCFSNEKNCPECGGELEWVTPEIKRQRALELASDPDYLKITERKRLIGIIGASILFIGVFTPIISLPIVGGVSYFQNGEGDGVIILILAIISLILTVTKKFGALWLTGIASLGLLIFTFVNLQARISEAKVQMEMQLSGNPFRGIADMAVQSIQIQWGWAVMIVGAGLVVAAAAIRKPE